MKHLKRIIPVATFLAVALGLTWISTPARGDDAFNTLPFDDIQTGYRVAPVPMNLVGRDPFLVGWGSYLVNVVGGCADCHTNNLYADGGNPYFFQPVKINTAGYLGGGQQFGPFTSRNLTPEANGLPAGLTFDQFQKAFQQGIDLDNAHPQFGPLLQVMPWPSYANMSTRQVRAIYEYLSAIPSVKAPGGN